MPNTTSFELSKQLFEVAKSKGVELPNSYTTDELLAWLPEMCNVYKHKDNFTAYCISTGKPFKDPDTPSNALAKLAIYLLENDLLK
jgi:hypothetical protein